MSKIVAINTDSLNLKWQSYQMPNKGTVAKGVVERIGLRDFIFTTRYGEGQKYEVTVDTDNHEVTIKMLLDQLIDLSILGSYDETTDVGHRVVTGGEGFKDSAAITDEVLEKIEVLPKSAPLRNPVNAMGVKALKHILPKIISVAIFDTSFHTTMPEHDYLYSVPRKYYEKFAARKHGAHGTSHRYVPQHAAGMSDRPIEDLRIITCHLENGASITAVDGGKSVDTSVGSTPLAGVIMRTHSGDVDASLLSCLAAKLGLTSVQDMVDISNKESGLLSLTNGLSGDMRGIQSNLDKPEIQTTYNIFIDRIRKYIGSYVTVTNGVDAIVLTAGIDENAVGVRKNTVDDMARSDCEIDDDKNNVHGEETVVSTDDSKIKLLLVPIDEGLMITRDVERLK